MLKIRQIISPIVVVSKSVIRFSSTAAPKEETIKVNNQIINYVRVGHGDHNALFLPGALGTIWTEGKPQVEGFDREKFTLVVWDPPGYGKSRPPEKQFGTDFYEKDAESAYQFMKALNISKYSLMGFSDGSVASLILAAKHPQVMNKLVVWGASSFILPGEIDMLNHIKDINAWSKQMREPLVEIYGEKLLAKYWASWTEGIEAIFHQKNGDLCSELIKDIKCPTFILHGQKDPMVDCLHASYLHKNIDMSRIHLYPI